MKKLTPKIFKINFMQGAIVQIMKSINGIHRYCIMPYSEIRINKGIVYISDLIFEYHKDFFTTVKG